MNPTLARTATDYAQRLRCAGMYVCISYMYVCSIDAMTAVQIRDTYTRPSCASALERFRQVSCFYAPLAAVRSMRF